MDTIVGKLLMQPGQNLQPLAEGCLVNQIRQSNDLKEMLQPGILPLEGRIIHSGAFILSEMNFLQPPVERALGDLVLCTGIWYGQALFAGQYHLSFEF